MKRKLVLCRQHGAAALHAGGAGPAAAPRHRAGRSGPGPSRPGKATLPAQVTLGRLLPQPDAGARIARALVDAFMPGTAFETAFGDGPGEAACDLSDDPGDAAVRTLGYTLLLLHGQAQTIQNLRNRVAQLERDATGR